MTLFISPSFRLASSFSFFFFSLIFSYDEICSFYENNTFLSSFMSSRALAYLLVASVCGHASMYIRANVGVKYDDIFPLFALCCSLAK